MAVPAPVFVDEKAARAAIEAAATTIATPSVRSLTPRRVAPPCSGRSANRPSRSLPGVDEGGGGLRGGDDLDHLEAREIRPVAHPLVEQPALVALHDLVAA